MMPTVLKNVIYHKPHKLGVVVEFPFAEFTEHMQCGYFSSPGSHDSKTKVEIFPMNRISHKIIEMEYNLFQKGSR